MSGNDKFESVGDFPCEWSGDKASNVAQDMINQYGDELVAIICDLTSGHRYFGTATDGGIG